MTTALAVGLDDHSAATFVCGWTTRDRLVMTEQTTSEYRTAQQDQQAPRSGATGLTTFAGVMMIMAGGFQLFNGLVALFANEFYVNTPDYLFKFDATRWGWTHLLIGVLVLLAGFAVLAGQTWGRAVGIVLALFSALANFAFVPYYPFWSLTIIALNVFVIWALATQDRDATI
jgi:hypothetical protein